MAISDFITPKMLILGSTLIPLIAMTPLCGGESYTFYESAAKVGLTEKQQTTALEAVIAAYKKEVPNYALKDQPIYATTSNPNEFLLLLHPYFGTCAPACEPSLMRKMPDGTAAYVKDIQGLNCRLLYKKEAKIICDHSQGFF